MSVAANEGPAHPYIDLKTLQIVMPTGKGALTGEEWRAVRWPLCPRCGATINVDRIDVTEFAKLVRTYTPGRWECPNECDPRIERMTRQGLEFAKGGMVTGLDTVRVEIYEDECIVVRVNNGWRCARPEHEGQPCRKEWRP